MTLINLGGSLAPVSHDGSQKDAVHGVDANGVYIGVVPAAAAAAAATIPPPLRGEWRWKAGAWTAFKPIAQRAAEIDMDRDAQIAAGLSLNGKTWYADPQFQQQLVAFITAFTEGSLAVGDTVGIRAKDGVVYQLTRLQIRLLLKAVIDFIQQKYADAWAAKQALQ